MLDDHIARLERNLKRGASAYVPRNLQEEAVRRFWTTGSVETLREARLVSYGVSLPVGPERLRVIEDREQLTSLLSGVDRYLPAPKQYRRCYRGLLAGYFGYDPAANDTPDEGRENWRTLRSYLGTRASAVRDADRSPQWVEALQQHLNLFGESPCARYGLDLLAGHRAEVDELREVLGISDSSWFMRQLFLAQIQAAVPKADAEFLEVLSRLLGLLQDNALIRDEGLALLLDRVARMTPPPLLVPLRDAAVNWWGNPWLPSNAMRWGRVTPQARAMVAGWLKLEFIQAFFTLLAEEHTGDNRRLHFWARYVDAIDDIHFALGADALTNSTPDFQALRKKMTGLVVPLHDTVRTNNAFIMRMGSLFIVEFSGYSNACYGYEASSSLPFRVDMPVVMPVDAKNSLKRSTRTLWLRHQDDVHGYARWEKRFEAELSRGYGIRPSGAAGAPATVRRPIQRPEPASQRPAPVAVGPLPTVGAPPAAPPTARPLEPSVETLDTDIVWQIANWKSTTYSRKALSQFADRFGLQIEDLTINGGNLWVRTDDEDLGINDVLLNWGFQFKDARKGWWKSP